MTTTTTSAPAATLTPAQISVLAAALANGTLGSALADGISYREPAWGCTDCSDETGDLCADHSADLSMAEAYARLRDELGIEEQ